MIVARNRSGRFTLRQGFTMLEVLVASAIGMLLLAALYFAFDLTLNRTDFSREHVRNGDLARAIVNRMTHDLSCSLAPLPPKSGGGNAQSSQGSTTGAASGTSSTTSSTSTSSSTSTASTSDSSSTETSATSTPTPTEGEVAADVPFQGGVFGSVTQLTLYLTRVPPDLVNPEAALATEAGMNAPRSDMRRVTYYLGTNGGLCRQEEYLVTADGVRNSTDPDISRESEHLIAPEVTSLTFEYFNGTSWVSEWAGDDSAEDGLSVIGPPRAIRATMTIQQLGGRTKQIQHVFAVRSAPGLYTRPQETTTDTTTEGM